MIKRIGLLITTIFALVILWSFNRFSKTIKTKPVEVNKGFAVVELFTSEGCSSCPAADEVVANLLKKNIKGVYILSYHVDYWNRLGWKDEFSKTEYSKRQQQYAKYLLLDGVYTPQVVVNGTTEFVGSNDNALNNAINSGLKAGDESNISISVKRKINEAIISYTIKGNEIVLLNTAVILPEADTKVRNGENGGKTLHHVNIVSKLNVAELKGSGELTVEIPAQLIGKELKIIAYTQDKKTLKALGADEVRLEKIE